MNQFAPLGIFLILAFIFPGLIIGSTLVLLFPEVRTLMPSGDGIELIGLILVIAFINGHPAHVFERYVLDPLWDRLFPGFRLKARKDLVFKRSRIIATAEANGLSHIHYDETLGEFVLFTNTAFGLFVLSGIRVSMDLYAKAGLSLVAMVVFVSSLISLIFSSSLFKKAYVDILEALSKEVDTKAKAGGRGGKQVQSDGASG